MPSDPRAFLGSLFERADPVKLAPCTITATSPLTISLLGQTGVLAVAEKGVTYTIGNSAVAFIRKQGAPLIYQIGP